MSHSLSTDLLNKVQAELDELDYDLVEIEGKLLRPSQCYHLETNPAHVLFNTNCPDTLKEKVQSILHKYIPNESRS